jgi:hypothetical protein
MRRSLKSAIAALLLLIVLIVISSLVLRIRVALLVVDTIKAVILSALLIA